MSQIDYDQAIDLIQQYPDRQHFFGAISDQQIRIAEQALGFRFPGQYRQWLARFGAGNFGSFEIYGVLPGPVIDPGIPNGVWYTLTERTESGLPLNLMVVFDDGYGTLYCVQCSDEISLGSVVVFTPGAELRNQSYETVASDFGEFLLKIVQSALDIPVNSVGSE